jgi:PAS domain S-box-containing protein
MWRMNEGVVEVGQIPPRVWEDAFNRAPTGFIVTDAGRRVTAMNPAAATTLGFQGAEARGAPVHALLHGESVACERESACALSSAVHGNARVNRVESAFAARDGRLVPVSFSVAPMPGGAASSGVIVTFDDTTEGKDARDRLRLYRRIVASSNDAIGIIDPQGRYVEQNAAHLKLLGYPDEELEGRTPALHLGEETFARIAATLRENKSFRGEAVARTRDGRALHLEISAFTIRDARGDVICHVGIKRDVTARRAAELELEAARRHVSVSEKLSALGTLVSGVAHEIRTPLTCIANNLHVVRARFPGDAPEERALAERVDDALEGVDRINRLVLDLRRFSNLSHGDAAPTDLGDALVDAVRLFESTHRGRGRVILDVSKAPVVPVDRMHVQQVVLNLVENAAEAFTGHGTIRVTAYAEDEAAVITVSDDGPGIPRDVQARMFDHFFTTKADGTGLGLAIVRRIVTANGGTITCDSRLGDGTTFTVRCPSTAQGAPGAHAR